VEQQVVSIFSGVNGYLDGISARDVVRFEQAFLSEMNANNADVLSTIREEKALSDDTTAKLKSILDDFVKKFA
jgi:F-type H+-transporting ATPase subunit alpha